MVSSERGRRPEETIESAQPRKGIGVPKGPDPRTFASPSSIDVMAIRTVLLDLDGVIRYFDPGHVASVEVRFGLETGALMSTAFEPELLERAITRRISRCQWTDEVGRRP